jgi:ribonuclease G
MPTEILISSDPWENRVAILEEGRLAELYFERDERVIGSVYKGKVQNVLPGMGAAFVDIGLGRNAFLYVDDINKTPLNIGDVEITQGRTGWSISEKVNRGDDVLVQIVKEPRGLKGARISTNISLPGRYLILMPTGKYSGVSRKIESAEERNRLKNIVKLIRPEGMATVVRTAAAGVSQAELIADLGVLIRMWHGILETYKRSPAPALIHKDMNLVYKAARDFITPQVDRVLIDDAEEFEKVRDFLRLLGPQYVDRIQLYERGRALFSDYKVDDEVQKLLRPKITLPSGGSIVIESTEALTVIDVNSGKFTGGKNLEDTIVKTNIEAAAEIARQVRLRDIGGIIVCDFIDMSSEVGRNKVLATLETGLRRDRTRTTIQSFSALGLLEFTRKRVGKDLAGQLRGKCPTCEGLGTVMSPESMSIEAFREVRHVAHEHRNGHVEPRKINVSVAPTVGAQLAYWYENETATLEREINAKVTVSVDQALHPERLKVSLLDGHAAASAPRVRVGDEIEAELLQTRLPNPTSALAVVNGCLVEVENAAAAVGQTIKIKIIDINEDGDILAEPRAKIGEGAERQQRHRRRSRGRELTPAEQTEEAEELRELAEEAAKGLGNRPPLGISTGSEPDVEDAEARARAAQQRGVAHTLIPQQAPPPVAAPRVVVPFEAVAAGASEGQVDEEGLIRRRRRRRRRRGRGGAGLEGGAVPGPAIAGIPQHSLEAQGGVESYVEEEASEPELGSLPLAAASYAGEAGQRRRRRRRRRGGAGRGQVVLTPENQAVPERHIFRAASDGRVEATGQTAPPEPSRAIAPVRFRSAAVAIEPPPRILTLVPEEAKVTRPARRRRGDADLRVAASIEAAAPVAALPRPAEPITDEPAPTRRRVPRKAAVEAEPVVETKPKKTATRKAATTKAAAAKLTPAKATTSATKKKSSAKKTTTRKVTTRKKKS